MITKDAKSNFERIGGMNGVYGYRYLIPNAPLLSSEQLNLLSGCKMFE